ncbi:mitochondrial enolase superfamily member 1-like [Clavelina lepadiformis]|uniref:mitochondrial enolase superfamily member 1-like n=1 Tax=Clavelina lepadiformis TaxID=159417 RepID=UPI004042E25D
MGKFGKITEVNLRDIRFPTSLEHHGSDAMHGEVDYSGVYVCVKTDSGDGLVGCGIAFTLGRGNEIILKAVEVISKFAIGQELDNIFSNFGKFWRQITQEGQLRWLGPEKGVTHMAAAGLFNAIWDIWGKKVKKPVWKLLADMTPQEIVNLVDFSYLSEVLTKDEAIEILMSNKPTQEKRERILLKEGFPAYTTSTGWLGYSDEILAQKCEAALKAGWTKFKMKVGSDLKDDKRRAKLIRDHIGYERDLMMDANQKWDVNDAISWMKELAEFKPLWIEEPTSPDDVLGHAAVAKALKPYNIGVATGEHCQNRVIFKQLLQANALSFLQIDSCRVGSINENIAILLLAKKFNVPVCPHAGGVGLCEMVQHIIMFDYLCVSGTKDGSRVCEYVDHLHEHFVDPVQVNNMAYMPPQNPGYSTEMKQSSLDNHDFPNGKVWDKLIREGKFKT